MSELYGYLETGFVTKDGHTMFIEDVVKDLNSLHKKCAKLESCNQELQSLDGLQTARVEKLESALVTAIETFKDYQMDAEGYPPIKHVQMMEGFNELLQKRDLEMKAAGIEEFFERVEPYISRGKDKLWKLENDTVENFVSMIRASAQEIGK